MKISYIKNIRCNFLIYVIVASVSLVTYLLPAISFAKPNAKSGQNDAANVTIVDIQEIIKESLVSKDFREKIEKKNLEFQKEFSEREKTLRDKDAALNSKRSLLSQEKIAAEEKEINTMFNSIQQDVSKAKMKLERMYSAAMLEINSRVKQIVKDLSAQRNYNIVMSANRNYQILYIDPSRDLTQEVLDALNKNPNLLSLEDIEAKSMAVENQNND